MVDQFHWLWATEWVCFSVEVVAGYAFVRAGKRLGDRARVRLLALYALASWASLFWINGNPQLAADAGPLPGDRQRVGGVLQPSFWPSLIFRTAVAMALAALAACLVINTLDLERERRAALIRRASRFAAPMIGMPLLAIWYVAVIPRTAGRG